ncbi:MAG: nuclear transport factor 2 family protein [Bacteroidetes bacterium]|nr:nuclear transport factor 2 family protein [Bacteroidota bacterium]
MTNITNREMIIRKYIDSYNRFDIANMVADFDDNIIFENIQNGETNMSLVGLTAVKQQAEQAKAYFSERTQTIKSFNHMHNHSEIEIGYRAISAMDFPNGLKKGQELNLSGKSIFEFDGDKIIRLTDIS